MTREEVRLGRKVVNNVIIEDERSSSGVYIAYDFQDFHGSKNENGARNYLYLDDHVDALIVTDTN
jgi:hypothetical protein